MLALAIVGGLLTLALLAKPTQAQGQGASSEQFPLEFTVEDSLCSGENILVTGTFHAVNHFTMQEDGTYHVTSHFNITGAKGVGLTTGEKYVVPAAGTVVENFVQSGQTVVGSVDFNMLIGQGEIPNQTGFARIHYVISPEGEVKVESTTFHFGCQPEPDDQAGAGA
jgi:hypothetical protein